jgi:hypothetical protein
LKIEFIGLKTINTLLANSNSFAFKNSSAVKVSDQLRMCKGGNSYNIDLNSCFALQGFNAYRIESNYSFSQQYSRKDFYKICLATGKSIIRTAQGVISLQGPVLFLGHPGVHYSWELFSGISLGYGCVFNEKYLSNGCSSHVLQKLSLLHEKSLYIFQIDPEQQCCVIELFEKMIAAQRSHYIFRKELIDIYISLLVYEMQKMEFK